MKKLIILAALALIGCADGDNGRNGANGSNGADGKTPSLVTGVLEIEAFRGGPNYSSNLDKDYYIFVPNVIFASPAHASGSPGWITLHIANKTFCYFATNSSASTGKHYNLQAVRAGNDISCTTGTQTNVSYSLNTKASSGSLVQFTVHTPRIANGESVELELETSYYELL
jgi:hypothetical protein